MVSGHDADQLWACLISLTKGAQYVTLMWRKLKTSLKTAVLHSGKCQTSPVLRLLWHKAHFSNKWNRRHVYRREIPDTGIVMLMLVSTLSWIPLHKTTPIPMNCSYKMNSPTKPQYYNTVFLSSTMVLKQQFHSNTFFIIQCHDVYQSTMVLPQNYIFQRAWFPIKYHSYSYWKLGIFYPCSWRI